MRDMMDEAALRYRRYLNSGREQRRQTVGPRCVDEEGRIDSCGNKRAGGYGCEGLGKVFWDLEDARAGRCLRRVCGCERESGL